ncbi:uncharacterized protein LOC135825395 isoform X1 [Sycon ciliatum]|uniref:uncharacterized protein LOC135825395 isoform X1 n=2 Tax=Sycon ciliatum TaxID=27933 RepID=UPI0031F7176A
MGRPSRQLTSLVSQFNACYVPARMGNSQSSDAYATVRSTDAYPWRCGTTTPHDYEFGENHEPDYRSEDYDYDDDDEHDDDDASIGAYTLVDLMSRPQSSTAELDPPGSTLKRSKTLPVQFIRAVGKSRAAQTPSPSVMSAAGQDKLFIVNLRGSPRHRSHANTAATRTCDRPQHGGEQFRSRENIHDPDHGMIRTTPDSGVSEGNPPGGSYVHRPKPRLQQQQLHARNDSGHSAALAKSNLSDSGCDSGEESSASAQVTPTGPPNIHAVTETARPAKSSVMMPAVAVAVTGHSEQKPQLAQTEGVAADDTVYAQWFRSHRVSVRSTARQDHDRSCHDADNTLASGDRAVVVSDFTAQLPDEMSVRRDDVIEVMRNQKSWLWVEDRHGSQGFVPSEACRQLERPAPPQTQQQENCFYTADAANCLEGGVVGAVGNIATGGGKLRETSASTLASGQHSSQASQISTCSTLHRNDSLKAAFDSSANSRQALLPEYDEWCSARRRRRRHGSDGAAYPRARSYSSPDVLSPASLDPRRRHRHDDGDTSGASDTTVRNSGGGGAAPVMGEMSVMVTMAPRISSATPTDAVSVDFSTDQEQVARLNAIERNRQLSELRRLLSLSARRDDGNEEKELMQCPPPIVLRTAPPRTCSAPTIGGSYGSGAGAGGGVSGGGDQRRRTPAFATAAMATGVDAAGARKADGTPGATAAAVAGVLTHESSGPHYLSVTNLMLHTQLASTKSKSKQQQQQQGNVGTGQSIMELDMGRSASQRHQQQYRHRNMHSALCSRRLPVQDTTGQHHHHQRMMDMDNSTPSQLGRGTNSMAAAAGSSSLQYALPSFNGGYAAKPSTLSRYRSGGGSRPHYMNLTACNVKHGRVAAGNNTGITGTVSSPAPGSMSSTRPDKHRTGGGGGEKQPPTGIADCSYAISKLTSHSLGVPTTGPHHGHYENKNGGGSGGDGYGRHGYGNIGGSGYGRPVRHSRSAGVRRRAGGGTASTGVMRTVKSHSDSSVATDQHDADSELTPPLTTTNTTGATKPVADGRSPQTVTGNAQANQSIRFVCRRSFSAGSDWQLPCQKGQWLFTRHKSTTGNGGGHDDSQSAVTLDQLTAGKKWIWASDPYTGSEGLIPTSIVALP